MIVISCVRAMSVVTLVKVIVLPYVPSFNIKQHTQSSSIVDISHTLMIKVSSLPAHSLWSGVEEHHIVLCGGETVMRVVG